MAIIEIFVQIKTGNAPAHVSREIKQFSSNYNIKHITGIPHHPTGQAVIEANIINKKRDNTNPQDTDYTVPY